MGAVTAIGNRQSAIGRGLHSAARLSDANFQFPISNFLFS